LGITIPQIASFTAGAVKKISSSLPSSTKVANAAQTIGSTKAATAVTQAAKNGFGLAKSAMTFLWSSVDSLVQQPTSSSQNQSPAGSRSTSPVNKLESRIVSKDQDEIVSIDQKESKNVSNNS
jgi:hypothetical protein